MKKLLLAFCVSALTSTSYAQEYFVLHVFGEIHNPKTNSNLKTGDKLSATDNIKFMGQGAKAMVMSPSSGRFVLAPSAKNKKSEETGFLMSVKNAVLPPDNVSYLSTRSLGGISTTENILNFKGCFISLI